MQAVSSLSTSGNVGVKTRVNATVTFATVTFAREDAASTKLSSSCAPSVTHSRAHEVLHPVQVQLGQNTCQQTGRMATATVSPPRAEKDGSHSRKPLISLASMCSLRDAFDGKIPPNITLSIVVMGASGDLAKKKTYPALFALYSKG